MTAVNLSDVVWADDLAQAIDCPSAHACPQTLGVAAGCLSDAFAEHGMRLSYGPKKTAATVLLRGSGSRQVAASLFRAPAGKFKGMLKGAARLERHRLECLDHLSSLHRALRDLAEGACLLPPTQDWDEAREACLLCRLACTSRLSWASHAARLHGYRWAATMLATGTTCRGCGKVYSSQGRLRRHVNYSAPCRQA